MSGLGFQILAPCHGFRRVASRESVTVGEEKSLIIDVGGTKTATIRNILLRRDRRIPNSNWQQGISNSSLDLNGAGEDATGEALYFDRGPVDDHSNDSDARRPSSTQLVTRTKAVDSRAVTSSVDGVTLPATSSVSEFFSVPIAVKSNGEKFTKLAKFAPTLVSTPIDRIEEFRTELRPDPRSRVSVLTTLDCAEAYKIIARADSDLNACIEYLKANNAVPNTHHPTNSASKGKRPFQESSNSHFSKKGKSVQTQSMASVDRFRKRKYPACEHCGRNHPGECWLKQGLCLGCGKLRHFKKECPTNPGEPFPSAPSLHQHDPHQVNAQQRGLSQPRIRTNNKDELLLIHMQ
ncbi:unnamed protein product [Cuscuta campestris]|uniref:CCHC-type domain-containing protein n=1 Tax=Cuscuta campestris TaxID=132261 RepID=A0A484L5R1_9ASTE|nr:unnamed protein product [Cuscuta campestris]